jgi:hypothetical protein
LKRAARKLTFEGFLKSFAVALLLLLIFYISHEAIRDVLIIDPIAVPKSFADAGLTPEVMANRVGEKLRQMETATETSMKKDVLGSYMDELSIPEVEIPGTKLNLKLAIDVTRSIFRRYPKHIGGDIVLPLAGIAPAPMKASSLKMPAVVTIYFRQGRNQSQALTAAVEGDDVLALVQQAAEMALEQVNPYLLAAYQEEHDELDKAIIGAQSMAEDPSQNKLYRKAAYPF